MSHTFGEQSARGEVFCVKVKDTHMTTVGLSNTGWNLTSHQCFKIQVTY